MNNEIMVEGKKFTIVKENPNIIYPGRTELWMHLANGRTAYIASRLADGRITSPVAMWGLKAR